MTTVYAGPGYLTSPYLLFPYLSTYRQGFTPSQVEIPRAPLYPSQVRILQYNISRLRVLMEFLSRGAVNYSPTLNAWGQSIGLGLNWTVNHTEPSSTNDFNIRSVNTDIVEQYWRSPSGTLATPSVLRCDTEVSGITIDTFAMLGTNLTTSALITLQVATDAAFTTPTTLVTLQGERDGNIVWISPNLPLNSYRFAKIVIYDPTNPDGFIKVGTIVFGNAVILSEQCFTNSVTWEPKHYVDTIDTEGQTAAMNDRGVKNSVTLEFKNLDFNKYDFTQLNNVFGYVRTSLKALWIPTPDYPKRFMLFGKLLRIPREVHNALSEDADYVDYTVEVDEAR